MFLRKDTFLAAVLCLCHAACATRPPIRAEGAGEAPKPAASQGQASSPSEQPPLKVTAEPPAAGSAPMTLNQTLAIAFERNPTFGEFAANREAARAEVIQALAYPNPEIEGSLGEATGRESPKTTKAEYGLSLVQPIESPLKRRTRRAAAEALEAVALREEDVFRVTLRSDTAKAYFTILYRQRAVGLAEAARQIAEDIEVVVTRRVDSGEAPEIDRIKARVEVLKASRAVQSEKRLLASARAVLRALCGDALPDSFQVADS
ncbi:TolC family protein, partial [Candidatus Sumerlaeota bacterium]|nr:TolC family protein [Candidatus Sumerlaeota bacterium]